MPDNFCPLCGGIHTEPNIGCKNPMCNGGCKRMCIRGDGCSWQPEIQPSAITPEFKAEKAKQTNLEELKRAFTFWITSSININISADAETLWQEFEEYTQEKLEMVDQSKDYFQVVATKNNHFKMIDLDKSCLFRNQNGNYVLVEENRRTKVSKVAVLEG